MKKVLIASLIGILCLNGTVLLSVNMCAEASGNIFNVGGNGEGNYTTIQGAIDNASDGDTVFVYSGIYLEHITVNKAINLIGEDRNNTIIDGGGKGDIVNISANRVMMSGFTIQNSGENYRPEWDSGLEVYHSQNVTISENVFQYIFRWGITLSNASNTTIVNNSFFSTGISIFGDRLQYWNTQTIENNIVNGRPVYYYKNNKNKVTIPAGAGQVILANCSHCTIQNQKISNVDIGIQLGFSSDNTISRNTFAENSYAGVDLENSSRNTISENIITNSKYYGIVCVDSCANNSILKNSLSNSSFHGILFVTSSHNIISKNTITNSTNDGIDFHVNCNNNTIVGNTLTNNHYMGIYFNNSHGNIINKNIVTGSDGGIYLYKSSTNEMINNSFTSCGISFYGDSLHHWNSHIITNNTANNKPIYYYKNNHDGLSVPSDAGQVILTNCSHFLIQHLTISRIDDGVQLGFSSQNTISSNNLSQNRYESIYVRNSSGNIIIKNIIANNEYDGIHLGYSTNNTMNGNTITHNRIGIYLDGSEYTTILNNTFTDNRYGIYPKNSLNNTISNNLFSNNTKDIWGENKTPEPIQPGFEIIYLFIVELAVFCVVAVFLYQKRYKKH